MGPVFRPCARGEGCGKTVGGPSKLPSAAAGASDLSTRLT